MACFYKRGKTWSFSLDIGKDEFGKRKKKGTGGFRTKKQAEEAAAKMKVELAKGIYIDEKNITFSEFTEEWLKLYKPTVKISTFNTRISSLKIILSYLKNKKINAIKKIELQQMIIDIQKKYTKSTVASIHAILSLIFKEAMVSEIIRCNPMQFVSIPREMKKLADKKIEKVKYLEKEEVKLFLDGCKKHQDYYAIFLLLSYTGMRIGEALALKWRDIDFDKKTVNINKTLYVSKSVKNYILQPPKTKRSERIIAVSEFVLNELQKHKQRQNLQKIKYRTIWHDDDFIFTAMKVPGYPCVHRFLLTKMKEILKEANLNESLSPHALRHTHTSLLAQAGVGLEEIMDRLGHENDKITRTVYLHVTKEMKKEAIKKFDLLMQN